MAIVTTTQPWEQKTLNQSGIRRLKFVNANAVAVLRFLPYPIVPQQDFVFYEFVFPFDIPCLATTTRQIKETGSAFWVQQISFTLPHISDMLTEWAQENAQTLWLAIAEDYNGITRAFGGTLEGLRMSFQASTGSGPKDSNPMGFVLAADQLLPYVTLPSYEDEILFPNNAGFTYGFSIGFNS